MSDTARHNDDTMILADVTDLDLPLTPSMTAPMDMPQRAQAPGKSAGKSDGAFERALEALEAAISDASAFPQAMPKQAAPVARLTPLAAKAAELVPSSAPAATPAIQPTRTIEPKFLPQEDIGDGDPIFVQPDFERVPAKSVQQAVTTGRAMPQPVSRPSAQPVSYGIPPLLLAADMSLRIRAAAKRVTDALPKFDAIPVNVVMPTPVTVPQPVVTPQPGVTVEPAVPTVTPPETAAMPTDETDPFTLYPFGKATFRLMVM